MPTYTATGPDGQTVSRTSKTPWEYVVFHRMKPEPAKRKGRKSDWGDPIWCKSESAAQSWARKAAPTSDYESVIVELDVRGDSAADAASGYGKRYEEPKQKRDFSYKGHTYSPYSTMRGFWSVIISGPHSKSHGEVEAYSEAEAKRIARQWIDEDIKKARGDAEQRFDSALDKLHALDARLKANG